MKIYLILTLVGYRNIIRSKQINSCYCGILYIVRDVPLHIVVRLPLHVVVGVYCSIIYNFDIYCILRCILDGN